MATAGRRQVSSGAAVGVGGAPREALLAAIWERRWLIPARLIDSRGRSLRVVYPGRRWGGPGPDFRGAVLALADGTLLRGDVEVHLRAADWAAHGHQRDPAYNRTILQVVLQGEAGPAARRADGEPVPALALGGALSAPLAVLAARLLEAPAAEEPACLESAAALIATVDRAGLERFFEKAGRFEADLAALGPAETFYRGFLVALGYSANKAACGRLGELLAWDLVARVAGGRQAEAGLRALLLGAAGLLPSQRGLGSAVGEPAELEARWRELGPELGRRPLPTAAWRLGGVRPENGPVRRLVGGAASLAAWAGPDFPLGLMELVAEAGDRPGLLGERFRARSAAEFWARHYDFGRPTAEPRPWQIGRPRAGEIVVNVLLPFAYAYGRSVGREELAAAALIAYCGLPAAPWNRITRTMAGQLFGAAGARLCAPAARQQGLLRIWERWCWERGCDACPAGPKRTGASVELNRHGCP